MKKTLLALAVASLSVNAFAVDLTSNTNTAVNYASEITLPAVLDDTGANDLDVTVALGFSATAGVKRYVRFDLTNAQFDTVVAAADITTDALDGAATPAPVNLAPSVSQGGTKGSNFVVIEITPNATMANNAKLKLALANINATGGEASVQYRLYETGVDAVAGNANVLASKSGKLFGLASGLNALVTTKGAAAKIDVAQESKFFVGAQGKKDNAIGSLTVGAATPAVYAKDGTAVTTLATLVQSANLEVTGDFSAGLKDAEGKLVPGAAVLSSVAAGDTTVTATKATYKLNPAVGLTNEALTLNVDGTSTLAAQTFTAKLVPVAQTGYTVAAKDLGDLGILSKNGDTQRVDLALNPGGTYSNFVRISNTSNLEGKFFITVIADDGSKAVVNLSDVADQPATLTAQASTTQISIQQIFDAAAAKGLSLSGQGKLRLIVEGEVPSLSVQSYTIAKDGNSFATF